MIKHWLQASRPLTLSASIAPISIACLYAIKNGFFNSSWASVVLLTAVLIQVGTNFVNDYADFEKGADNAKRKGPKRMVQAGLISVKQMKIAAALVFFLAFLLGLFLVYHAGIAILVIGLISMLLGYMYTAGPFPLAYLGLADLIVLLFFGPIATAGTAFVLNGQWHLDLVVTGLGVGCISAALLAINNLRDCDEDKLSNKKTLVVRFGKHFGRFEYIGSLVLSIVCLGLTASSFLSLSIVALYAIVCLRLSIQLIRLAESMYITQLKRTGILLYLYPLFYAGALFL